jgi:DNA-binding MarR family transcriptional regulator
LDYLQIEVGYNSGQFHHGTRKDEKLIADCLQAGILLPYSRKSRTGEPAYQPFAKYCLAFALRNRAGQVTGLYFRSTVNNEDAKHFYLKDSEGLYPCYPKAETERLIITEAIIDAASLLQIPSIATQYGILSAYGTNRLKEEHINAIKELKQLQEIIFSFDNDEAGITAAKKYAAQLKETLPNIIYTTLQLPCKDVNETFVAHEPEIFNHLLEGRTDIFLFQLPKLTSEGMSSEKPVEPVKEIPVEKKKDREQKESESAREAEKTNVLPAGAPGLDIRNPFKLTYKTDTATYHIKGGVSKALDNLKVTLEIINENLSESIHKRRFKVDLYDHKQTEKLIQEASELLQLRKDLLEADIYKLTDLLDDYREREMMQAGNNETKPDRDSYRDIIPLTARERNELESFAKKPKLIKRLNEILGTTGIVGEERNRIFLLCIAISHIQKDTLHALIQGSSGSGKTRLLSQVCDCMPKEKTRKYTRVSDKVLYNFPQNYFCNTVVFFEDIDGLSEEAEYAVRQLQSDGALSSASSIKLDNGQITAGEKIVKGPIASISCTTKGEIYEDNISRVFLIAVDESKEKIKQVIEYQNKKAAGAIDIRKEQQAKKFIQNFVRILQPYEIVNPYAQKIFLPEDAHKLMRLNEMFQHFVKIITLVNQYQRRRDERGRLITEKEDIRTAVEIMFETIVLKVDELDGSLRQFFEKLKDYLQKTYNGNHQKAEFAQRDIRQALNVSKAQIHRYLNTLQQMEYIQQTGGYANKGFKFKITYWDNYTALRDRIRKHLDEQLQHLE